MRGAGLAALAALVFAATAVEAAETWRGLVVAPERRCAPYDKRAQYPYPQSVEARIVEGMGGRVYGPCTGRYFASRRETDVEHLVAISAGEDDPPRRGPLRRLRPSIRGPETLREKPNDTPESRDSRFVQYPG